MKKIGIIGGMSVESTALYYKDINDGINIILGKNHSAKIILSSVDFEEIVVLQKQLAWQEAGIMLANEAKTLANAEVDGILLATNTMHKVADYIIEAINIPFLHLIDATAEAIKKKKLKRIGLLGTSFTMSDGFYHKKMQDYGIEVITPDEIQQKKIHDIIFNELCHKIVLPESRDFFLDVIETLNKQGAEGVILGCTEICLLINKDDTKTPLFDSTSIHIETAISFILSDSKR